MTTDDLWLDEATGPRVRALLSGLTGPATDAELAREAEIVTAMAEAVLAGAAGDVAAKGVDPASRAGTTVRARAARRLAVAGGVVAISFATAAAASEIVTSLTTGDQWPERPPTVTQPEAPPTDDGPPTEAGEEEGPRPGSTDDLPSAVPPGPGRTTTTTSTTTTTTAPAGGSAGSPAASPGRPDDPGGSGGPPSSLPGPPADPGPPDTRPGAAGRGVGDESRSPGTTSPPATGSP
jgi:hypothetical protein